MANLITEFKKEARAEGKNDTEALKEMNKDMGTNYTLSRLREWERGRVPLSPQVEAYLMRRLLPRVIVQAGMRPLPNQLDKAVSLLTHRV